MQEHLGERPRSRDKRWRLGVGGTWMLQSEQDFRASSFPVLQRNSWKLVPSSATTSFLGKLKINGPAHGSKGSPWLSLCRAVQAGQGCRGSTAEQRFAAGQSWRV